MGIKRRQQVSAASSGTFSLFPEDNTTPASLSGTSEASADSLQKIQAALLEHNQLLSSLQKQSFQ